MKFQKPEFKPGLNMTVRRGIKTYQEIEQLTDAEGNPVGWGRIVEIKYMRFCKLENEDITECHHLSEVRNPSDAYHILIKKMREHYPLFDAEEIVTVVYFEVINETGQ